MVNNPITEEIREIRHSLAAEFDNDVYRIGAELRRRQVASGGRVLRPLKRTSEIIAGNNATQQRGSGPASANGQSLPTTRP